MGLMVDYYSNAGTEFEVIHIRYKADDNGEDRTMTLTCTNPCTHHRYDHKSTRYALLSLLEP